MSFKNYILEDWVKGILAHPVTKETIQLKAIASKGKIPDATVFLKNTKGWFEWVEGQSQFERWLRKGEYKSYKKTKYRNEKQAMEKLYKKLSLKGVILDVGGSVGTLREFLKPNTKYLSLDPDSDPLKSINKEKKEVYNCLKYPLNFIRGCAEFLPLKSMSVDTVHMRSMLDHVQIPDLAILEAHRVLKQSGNLIIGIYLPSGKSTKTIFSVYCKEVLRACLVTIGFKSFQDHHTWHPSYNGLVKLLFDNGFKIYKEVWQEGWDEKVLYLTARKIN